MTHSIKISLVLACVMLCIFNGCSNERAKRDGETRIQNALIAQEDALLSSYMTGDVDEARHCLRNSIQHLKASDKLDPSTQASILYMDYVRLFVLESRSGHPAAANDALTLGRFWRLKSLGSSIVTNDDKIIRFMSEPPSAFLKYVDALDAGDTGRTPAYLKTLTNSPFNKTLEPIDATSIGFTNK